MDKETKITYGSIAVIILFLGGLAYFLQPMSGDIPQEQSKPMSTKPLTTTDKPKATTTATTMDQQLFSSATITTNKGVIEIALLTTTPLTVKNFGTLANTNFYDGVRFHRVIKGFMIQTGDPLSKDVANQSAWGTGGPGYKFNDELTGSEQYPLGTVAMANSGKNTNGSQFFIVTANPGAPLPPNYTVFGKVTKGIEVALAIEGVKTDQSDRPLDEIVIQKLLVK